MASSIQETGVTWSSAASVTVSSATVVASDAITLNAEDWDGALQVNVDNAGTPSSGDVCDVYVAWSNGDVLGDSGDDYDTTEHAEFVGRLDTYSSNTPGEDPARRTWGIEVSGKKGMKVLLSCPQAASRNIVARARLVTHRPQ